MNDKIDYFYQKSFFRSDGCVYVKRYSRSFERGKVIPRYDEKVGTNVKEATLSRARSRVRLLAFSNPQLVGFLTLTFKDNITDEIIANHLFDLYRRRVAEFYKPIKWQFLGVHEYQKRGAIHFHLLVNFCPDQVDLPLWDDSNNQHSNLWTYGISHYELIHGDDSFRTELYLLKYLGKNKQLQFTNYYLLSRGLHVIEPRYYRNIEPIHPLAENIFFSEIKNPFVDKFVIVEYTYNITNKGVANYAYKP